MKQPAFDGNTGDFEIQAVGRARSGGCTTDTARHGQHAIDGLKIDGRVVHVQRSMLGRLLAFPQDLDDTLRQFPSVYRLDDEIVDAGRQEPLMGRDIVQG